MVAELREGGTGTTLAGSRAVMQDGRLVLLRPVRAEDADRVQSFVRALSPESRRSRFFGGLSELSPYMLRRLTQPAYPKEFGLIALSGASGAREVVGIAQYAREPSSRAELSVVVADAWQRQGLGTQFIRILGDRAALCGVRTLSAVVLAYNSVAFALMRRLGWAMVGRPEPGLVQFEKAAPLPGAG